MHTKEILNNFLDYVFKIYEIQYIEDVNKDHVYSYLKNNASKKLSDATIDRHMISLRQFYQFLIKEKIVSQNIMSSFEMPKRKKISATGFK